MNFRYLLSLLFLPSLLLMSGCTPGIQFNPTFQGDIFPTAAVQNGHVNLVTQVSGVDKATDYKEYESNLSQALTDAFKKHGISVVEKKDPSEYRLQTKVDTLPEMDLWQAKQQLGKNLGIASIPIAGTFIPRFYTISSGFTISFDLFHVDQLIHHENYEVNESKEIRVSNTKQFVESRDAAVLLWEESRNSAIEKFFASLNKSFPPLQAMK